MDLKIFCPEGIPSSDTAEELLEALVDYFDSSKPVAQRAQVVMQILPKAKLFLAELKKAVVAA